MRSKLCWAVPPRSVRPTAVALDPKDFEGGLVEFAILQEQVQWLTDLQGWTPVLLDLRTDRFVGSGG